MKKIYFNHYGSHYVVRIHGFFSLAVSMKSRVQGVTLGKQMMLQTHYNPINQLQLIFYIHLKDIEDWVKDKGKRQTLP